MEKQLQIQSGSQILYSHLFLPEKLTDTPDLFIFCPPFFEEKKSSHRVIVELARALLKHNIGSLIFDFSGCGDSSGNLGDCGIDDWLNDIKNVVDFVKKSLPKAKINLFGVRLSASICILAAAKIKEISCLVLIEPILTGQNYLDEMFRQKLVREMMTFSTSRSTEDIANNLKKGINFDFDGFVITQKLYESIAAIDLKEFSPPEQIDCLLVQISPKKSLVPDLAKFTIKYKGKIDTICLSLPPFWKKIGPAESGAVIEDILQWVKKEKSSSSVALRPCPSVFDHQPLASSSELKPVSFTNKNQQIYGVLHIPKSNPQNIGIVFSHGWGTYRIGPHRLLVQAAAEFAKMGFACLRFDFRGRGESEGQTSKTNLTDMIDDAESAVEFMLKEAKVDKVILLGLCSGGEVAVGTACVNPAISGLILWSTPLLARQAKWSSDARRTTSHAKSYWQKLFLPETWKKIFSFRVNYMMVFRVLFSHFTSSPPKTMKEKELLEKFRTFQGKILFVYGGNDPDCSDSQKSYRTICDENQLSASFHVIKEANHNFYSLNWKMELIETTKNWLEKF